MDSQKPIELNNLGVAALAEGNLRKSLDCFCDALEGAQVILQTLKVTETVEHDVNPICVNFDATGQPDRTCDTSNKMEPDRVVGSLELITPGNGCFGLPREGNGFVHSQGIAIATRSGSNYLLTNRVDTSIAISVMLFNIGIVHHVKGLEEDVGRIRRLRKAKAVYGKCYAMLLDAGMDATFFCRSTGNAVMDLLLMALLNNSAQICYELFEYRESRSFFDNLLYFLQTVDLSSYGNIPNARIMDKHRSMFAFNATSLCCVPLLAAAA